MPFFQFLLFSFLLPTSVLAQGAPIRVIDDSAACGKGRAPEVAKNLCHDFEIGKLFATDPQIKAAHQRCLAFYEVAIRLQNTFCAYSFDAVVFKVNSEAQVQRATVGESNVSQNVVAKDNRKVAEINRAYMAKLEELREKLNKNYMYYFLSLGKLNSAAGSDKLNEAICTTSLVYSQVPGYVRELLAAVSYSTARITRESMNTAVRENYRKLKSVKAEAEVNATLAEMRGLEAGTVFAETVSKPSESTDPRVAPTPMEGATYGAWQYVFTKTVERVAPKIPAGAAAAVAGGTIIAYQLLTNKQIMFPETAATFIGILNPVAGIAAGWMVGAGRTDQAILAEYSEFSHGQLGKNVNLTSMQLVDLWGHYSKKDKCVSRAAEETACIEKRKTMQAYEHNSCSRNSLMDRQSKITGP